MPMAKDPGQGGTEADGSKSGSYCSLCYRDGGFTDPGFTAAEMQAFCVRKMKEQGMNGFLAWLLTRHIPRLGRWRG